MAVEETIELCEKLVGELTMRPRCVICNLTSPLLASPDPEFENLYRQMIPEGTDSNNLKFILDRHAIERSLFQRLRSAIGVELQTVERRPYCETDLDLLLDLSCRLETLSGV